jgi:Leucine-rich repeat (LRR) protein
VLQRDEGEERSCCVLAPLAPARAPLPRVPDDAPHDASRAWSPGGARCSSSKIAVSRLIALSILSLSFNLDVSDEVLRSLSTLTALKTLNLSYCLNVSDEGLRAVSSLTALTTLNLLRQRVGRGEAGASCAPPSPP